MEKSSMDPDNGAEGTASLTCQPTRDGDMLVFPYQVRNDGRSDIYVFDAVPDVDPVTRAERADPNGAVIALASDGYAHILRGIAPLPTDFDVMMRIIPLAARLAPGQVLERRLTIGMPLHETGPYHGDLPIRQYRQRDIAGFILTVQYLPATTPGFGAVAADYAPGLFRVATKDTVASTMSVSCRLPARGLTILQRTDAFPRPN
jgi:hypothetical protein